MASYKSKYFGLKSAPKGWTLEEFVPAVQMVEGLSRATLEQIVASLGIRFSSPVQSNNDEPLIFVLFDDVEKTKLLEALRPENLARYESRR